MATSNSLRHLKVSHLKRKAEAELKAGNYGHAVDRYTEAISLLLPTVTPARPPTSTSKHLTTVLQQHLSTTTAPTAAVAAGDIPELRALLSNRSLALLKAGRATAAAEDAAAVTVLAPGWHKGHWRLGKALCDLSRWSDALDCFARSWSLCEPGSTEQQECEQQLLSAVQKLTRQELADRLLAAIQPAAAAHNSAHALQHPTQEQLRLQSEVTTAGLEAPAAAGGNMLAVAADSAPPASASPTATTAANSLFASCQAEELREAMFQLVKAAQQQHQQQHHAQGASARAGGRRLSVVSRMQALLLKWLILHPPCDVASGGGNSSGVESSRLRKGSAHVHSSVLPLVLSIELQLLTAQLAVKLKQWVVAQAVATHAQTVLQHMVLSDEGVLLQLLVDCHIVLGDACWAAGPGSDNSNSSSGGSSGSNGAGMTAQQHCQPYQAAAACLTALDLLPVATAPPHGGNVNSSSNSSSNKAKPSFVQLLLRSGAVLGGCKGSTAAAASSAAAVEQLRRGIQSRLTAALEQLSDLEQAAVWASAAAARRNSTTGSSSSTSTSSSSSVTFVANKQVPPTGPAEALHTPAAATALQDGSSNSSGGSGVTGWQLACMQVSMQQQQMHDKVHSLSQQPAMLVSVRIEALQLSAAAVTTTTRSTTTSSTTTTTTNVSSSSAVTRGLSGSSRVALLKGLARAAGVGQLAVGLRQIRLSQKHTGPDMGLSGSCGSGGQACTAAAVESLSFKVQFGADVAAAQRFAALCSSMEALAAACRELAATLLDSSSGGHSSSTGSNDGCALSQLYRVAAVDTVDLSAVLSRQSQGSTAAAASQLSLSLEPQPDAAAAAGGDCVDVATSAAATSSVPEHTSLSAADAPSSTAVAAVLPDQPAAVTTTTATAATANAVIPLPYAHYQLVGEDGRPLERPDKHPFALSRVLYDARELPSSSSDVWSEAAEGAYRWRQTASTVLLQLHVLPDYVTSAKQLVVTVEPYTLRVIEQSSGDLLFEADLARGIIPEDSTWVLVKPDNAAAAAAAGRSCSGSGGRSVGLTAAAASALVPAARGVLDSGSGSGSNGCHILFELSKMNLELYARPNQHSASWWPRLLADDATDVAWDDTHKDYTDLPPAIAAAAAAEAAREDEAARRHQERREARDKLQALVDRHKEYRWERLRQLKAAAWRASSTA